MPGIVLTALCIFYMLIPQNNPIATTWINIEDIILSKIIQLQKVKYYMIILR